MRRTMEPHHYYGAMLGGLLVGIAAGMVLIANGRLAGGNGMISSAFRPRAADAAWQMVFPLGLVAGGAVLTWFDPAALPVGTSAPIELMVGAGLLVGFGARLGGGCTSGHSLTGVGRLARRSIVATMIFVAAGALAVLASQHILGGLR